MIVIGWLVGKLVSGLVGCNSWLTGYLIGSLAAYIVGGLVVCWKRLLYFVTRYLQAGSLAGS